MNTDHSHIVGWGADLDRRMRPAVPKERTPPRLANVHWDQPEQQHFDIKVFHSNERPDFTPLIGTSAPPSGLSGLLRAGAFRFSENDIRHWLILLFADRINMVEEIFEDLMKGHIPNFFAEAGWKGEFKHNPKAVIARATVYTVLGATAIYFLQKKFRSRAAET